MCKPVPRLSHNFQPSAVCGLRSAVSRSPHPPNRVGAKPLYAAKPRGGEAPLRGPLFDWSTAPESATFPVLAPQINAATTEFRPQPVIFRRRTKSAFPFSAFSFHPSACSHYPLPATTSVVAGQPLSGHQEQRTITASMTPMPDAAPRCRLTPMPPMPFRCRSVDSS